ncbi:nephrin-like isoform X2 [Contarinia nasturtii]|uniref:nephrin-like isoform X2 n=1 Tax=Contarinia nasturtii TaxID=265458 RepID=UPI0012D49BB7|nr:nephrin-like isoform X2 [Contarinia nasturtii]
MKNGQRSYHIVLNKNFNNFNRRNAASTNCNVSEKRIQGKEDKNSKKKRTKQVIKTYIPMDKMKSQHGIKLASNNGSSRHNVATTITTENNAHGKAIAFRNCAHFFNLIATILFATIMIVNVRHSCGLIEIQTEKEKHVRTIDVQAVEGNRISLPCPLIAPSRDKVYMVLWFRDDAGIPLYSFDVRGRPLNDAQHWSAPETFGSRARFNADVDPATLDIKNIKRHDQGIYRCRVDFRTSQTQSFRYNLTIIIPPEYPLVLNRWGHQLNGTILGPMEEGDDIVLTCRVTGGRPQPQVRWLVNGVLVDDQYEHNTGDVIENRLLWPAVQRSDLNAIFTCQAVNTILVEPKENSYMLDLHLKPLTVDILETPPQLVAERRYEIRCESSGSRPNAIITWYKGKRQLRRTKDETVNTTSRSELSFVPSTEDDGKSITCRAENPKVTGLFLETTWKLNVVYPPIVTLRLGSTLSDNIKEGDDVYFECLAVANPQWRKLYWLHDGVVLTHNASARVIRSNQSLVLQRVTRHSAGNYSCSAINAEGETVSNQLELRVKYAPLCVSDKVVIVGAFRNENLNIYCEVQADPPPRSFRWKFNNSGETLDVGKERHHRNGSTSVLQYTPVTDQDYGTLSCWGQNEVGIQSQPCVFQIVLASLPSAVRNCTYSNQTQISVEIHCIAGYDGGLPQYFVLELVSTQTGRVRFNLTNSEEPYFLVESLEALHSFDSVEDRSFRVVIYALNQKGRSPKVILKDLLIGDRDHHPNSVENGAMQLSPIFFGILLTILCLMSYCVVRILWKRSQQHKPDDVTDSSKQSSSLLCTSVVGNTNGTTNNANHTDTITKKYSKSSPRWQYNNSGNKDIKAATELLEDERDPDVIPAQFSTNDISLSNYKTEWSDEPYYDIKYSGHENRPKNLLLKSVTTNVPSQDLILGSYFTNSNNSCSSTTTTGTIKPTSTAMVTAVAMGLPTTTTTAAAASANATSIDLDINVHAIKNMLMATRVPESCV